MKRTKMVYEKKKRSTFCGIDPLKATPLKINKSTQTVAKH
jgi:hypothetical protein